LRPDASHAQHFLEDVANEHDNHKRVEWMNECDAYDTCKLIVSIDRYLTTHDACKHVSKTLSVPASPAFSLPKCNLMH
jgi:hypothetical protein